MPWATNPYPHYHTWYTHWFPSLLCRLCKANRR